MDRLSHVLALSDEAKSEMIARSREGGRAYRRRNHMIRAINLFEAKKLGRHTAREWRIVQALYGHACLRCGYADSEKDHIVPISKGGSDAVTNLQPLCVACNVTKRQAVADWRWDGGEWLAVAMEERDMGRESGFH
jgi:hypothetical protein